MTGSDVKDKYVGRRVHRVVDGRSVSGTVMAAAPGGGGGSVPPSARRWRVAYDDGTAVDLDRRALLRGLDMHWERDAAARSDRSHVGRRVARKFGAAVVAGTIVRRVPARGSGGRWRVAYDWGGVDVLDRRELWSAMDLFQDEGGEEDAEGRQERDEAAPAESVASPRGRRERPRDGGDRAPLFSFDRGDAPDPDRDRQRPRRTLREVRRFDPLSYDAKAVRARAGCPIGRGFACPRCAAACGYDATRCATCGLECGYIPGVGARVTRARPAGRGAGAARDRRESVEDVTDLMMRERRKRLLEDAIMID